MANVRFFPGRKLRICYLDTEKRFVDSRKGALERQLALLGEVDLVELARLEDPAFHPCDLLIVAAEQIPDNAFEAWLKSLQSRIKAQQKIWTPALIFSSVERETLADLFTRVTRTNWYFDILYSSHVESLPIRVANLLRIHDHLHELRRYVDQLDQLTERTTALESQITQGKKDS